MATGVSRDLTVNLIGNTRRLQQAFSTRGGGGLGGILGGAGGKAGIVAVAVVIGQTLMKGLSGAFDREDLAAQLQASLGLDPVEANRQAGIAASAWADGWGSSLSEVGGTVGALSAAFGGMSDADLEALTAQASAFAAVFGTDVPTAVTTAGTLLKSGLVDDGQEAFDLLTVAMQKMPVGLRGELLDATSEYSQFFHALGIDGTEAFGLLVDASADGQFGIDKTGDAIKEFSIRATDMSASTKQAFGAIGLDAQEMANAFLAGGDTAREAFEQTVEGLLGIEDPAERANAAIALFGTPIEDLGVNEIPAFLEGLLSMESQMGDVDGAAQAMADTIGGTTRQKFEAFKRQALDKLVAGTVAVIEHFKEFGIGGGVVRALQGAGTWLLERGRELAGGLLSGAREVWDETVLPWIGGLPELAVRGLGNLGETLRTKGTELLAGLRDGALSTWRTTILPWIQSIPTKAKEGIGDLISTLWAKGASLLSGLWNGIQDTWRHLVRPWLTGLPGRILAAVGDVANTLWIKGNNLLSGLLGGVEFVWDLVRWWFTKLPGRVVEAVGNVLQTLRAKGRALLGGLTNGVTSFWGDTLRPWLTGLPQMIRTAIGGLRDVLYDIGRNVITGLWDGMRDMWNDVAGWLTDLAGEFPILKGPPEYDAKILIPNGEQIMAGLQKGLRSGWDDTVALLGGMTSEIPLAVGGSGGSGGNAPVGGGITINGGITVGSSRDLSMLRGTIDELRWKLRVGAAA